ncbi:sigma-70 family RNA polymerase sigma factor [Kitasatospora acidiphila]|uniref:Sigma-70 family RNA polymerase sigma factor n=1 Tax=Kitasatospora acidiphila TaxID=2567942 RepID=A0A540W6P1_9ACTN|nr:sigma-70 family RNA polymerase sigma factor [Kitasatospora acidiphila]TQF04653.1 sigma-70 family RNA polymerase sigma factor [Kitasatospora acidiphila]
MTSDSSRSSGRDFGFDTESFDDFFARTYEDTLKRAVMLCGHREDAEEAVIEAYGRAAARWEERLRGYESPEGWVFRVVKQEIWKKATTVRKQLAALLLLPAARQATTEQTVEARAALDALKALPERQRIVMVLNCLYAVPQSDIADQLGITPSAVANHVLKARRALRAAWGFGPDEEVSGLVASPSGGLKQRGSLFQDVDPLVERLAEAEAWLQARFESDPGVLDQARARIAAVSARVGGGRA